MNRLLLLPFILLIAAHTALAQDNGTTMTLNQAIELALKNNREAKNAKLEIDKAEANSARSAPIACLQSN